MSTSNVAANYIASISAFVGCCSALMAFLSYRKSVEHHDLNKKEMFYSKCHSNLDSCYMALNDFVRGFSGADESKEKRTSRDKIMYLIETLRVNIVSSNLASDKIRGDFTALEMRMSDITYEDNFEKVFRDLRVITNSISSLKNSFSQER